jgi:colanic acid/amylovoran biosynthesis glycosyltransferase
VKRNPDALIRNIKSVDFKANQRRVAMARKSLRLAYITDVFPGTTLTFIYLEVKKLREQGLDIDLYAIWKSRHNSTSTQAESFAAETKYLAPPAIWRLICAHYYYVRTNPRAYREIFNLCLAHHTNMRLRRRTTFNFFLAPYLAELLAKNGTTHIHAHFASGAATTAMMASLLLNISFSFTAHRGDILEEKVLLREKLKKAKFGIAISEYNRQSLLREAPDVDEHKITTIHCGVETDVFFPAQRTGGDPLVLLSVGSLLERKGHAYLVEACRLLQKNGIDYRCIIIGDGPQKTNLENLIRRYEIKEKVKLAGSVPHEDVRSYYTQADIFVLPSLNEGIPVVLMEAMSNGLPVVSTQITGVPELVTHEEDGILVPPADHTGLAEAMIRLIKEAELRKQLGANARRKILSDFNLDINARKIKTLFEQAVAS